MKKAIILPATGALVLAGAGTALGTHTYPPGNGNGAHWANPGAYNHPVRVAYDAINVSPGDWRNETEIDARWTDPSKSLRPMGRWNYGTNLVDFVNAPSTSGCTYPDANLCVRETNDPALACGGSTNWAGCAITYWLNGAHAIYRENWLNWHIMWDNRIQERDQTYGHELGHALALSHMAGTIMEPTATGNIQWPTAHDYEMVNGIHNHVDGFSYAKPADNRPVRPNGMPFATVKLPKNNPSVRVTKTKVHANGVIDATTSDGKQYRIGAKTLTKTMLDQLVRKGVLTVTFTT